MVIVTIVRYIWSLSATKSENWRDLIQIVCEEVSLMEKNEANRSEKVRKGLRSEGYYYRRHLRADAEHRETEPHVFWNRGSPCVPDMCTTLPVYFFGRFSGHFDKIR